MTVGEGTNIWYGAILRGDVQSITIGQDTNIQDGTVIHLTTGGRYAYRRPRDGWVSGFAPDCTIEDEAYIGMQPRTDSIK